MGERESSRGTFEDYNPWTEVLTVELRRIPSESNAGKLSVSQLVTLQDTKISSLLTI